MNTFWSDSIQSTEELYASRELRFREDNEPTWLPALGAWDGMRVLEIGCAGGLLLHRLKKALPHIDATGLDRDDNHITFARAKSEALGLHCRFVTGDALALPFADDAFDLCFSHTVIEHVPTALFLAEQKRVLRPGGRVTVLSVRTRYSMSPEGEHPGAGEEKDLMDKLWASVDMEPDRTHGVGQYDLSESGIPRALETAGFSQVEIQVFSLLRYAPDSACTPAALAERQINEGRTSALESMKKALRRSPNGLSKQEAVRLTELIDRRFDERIAQYRRGEKRWDIGISFVLSATGTK